MIAEGEINRLKELPEDYDVELFNFYYKSMTPLIRKLAKNIDPRRFNVSRDIIISYFYDKLLYVFRKYYNLSTENPEKFKATIISSLQLYKTRLLINAYSKQSWILMLLLLLSKIALKEQKRIYQTYQKMKGLNKKGYLRSMNL